MTLNKPSCGNKFPMDVQPAPVGFVTLISHLANFLSLANCVVSGRAMTESEAH